MLLVVGGPGTGGEQALPERILVVSDVSSDIPDVRLSLSSYKNEIIISIVWILDSYFEHKILLKYSK